MVMDVTSKNAFKSIKKWKNLMKTKLSKEIFKCIIGNKIDLKPR